VEDFFLDAAASNGVWAALSLALIFFILRAQERRDAKQDEREQNYQKIIEELTQKLHIITDMREDIEKIRDTVTTHSSDMVGQ
jgi:membrane protein implicated in regulation of membrane protease activity